MSTTTSNYNLVKPALADAPPDITVMNPNWDKIDQLLGDAWYKTAIVIESGANLDNYTNIGIYTFSSASSVTITNAPATVQSTLIVLPRLVANDPANRIQFIIAQSDKFYIRNMVDGVWGVWRSTVMSGDGGSGLVPDTCTTISDWNDATKTGWYMGSNAANAPTTAWFFGYVIAHNSNYVLQEVYAFTNSSVKATDCTKYIRHCYDGTWTPWVNVTVQRTVPEAAKLEHITTLTSDAQAQLNGKMMAKPAFIELSPAEGSNHGGYIDFHYGGSTEDYTCRIMEGSQGKLALEANTVVVRPYTDYSTYKLRNAAIVSATPSSMNNGDIAFVYG